MIEDATKPLLEPIELYDESESQPCVVVERSGDAVTLSLKEAAFALGKSMRALERSLSGKWGNKLPDGWSARKVMIDDQEEWQISPPPGFNVDALLSQTRGTSNKSTEFYPRENGSSTRQILTKAASALTFGKPLELQLLRELAATHKELSEERRAHLEDLKLLASLQSSMRLLETNAAQTATLKSELIEAQRDLITLKTQYQHILNLPWWKRIFVKQ